MNGGESIPSQTAARRHGVVAACRRRDGRWLMIRRCDTVSRAPGKVCFPGGEVEPGETQAQAVAREIREELGIEVRPIRCVWRYDWPDRPWVLWGWLAEMVTADVRPSDEEIAEVLWLTDREGGDHADGMPTNRLFLAALAKTRECRPLSNG